jgi:hypothetical protein
MAETSRIWISGFFGGSEKDEEFKRGVIRACSMLGFDLVQSQEQPLLHTGAGPLMISELYAIPRGEAVADYARHSAECDSRCACKAVRKLSVREAKE